MYKEKARKDYFALAKSNKRSLKKILKEIKKQLQYIRRDRNYIDWLASYGCWKYKAVEEYISEFWTHVPSANALLTEVAAVGGRIFLTVHQRFEEDIIIQSLLDELKRNGISYKVHKYIPADNAHFPLP